MARSYRMSQSAQENLTQPQPSFHQESFGSTRQTELSVQRTSKMVGSVQTPMGGGQTSTQSGGWSMSHASSRLGSTQQLAQVGQPNQSRPPSTTSQYSQQQVPQQNQQRPMQSQVAGWSSTRDTRPQQQCNQQQYSGSQFPQQQLQRPAPQEVSGQGRPFPSQQQHQAGSYSSSAQMPTPHTALRTESTAFKRPAQMVAPPSQQQQQQVQSQLPPSQRPMQQMSSFRGSQQQFQPIQRPTQQGPPSAQQQLPPASSKLGTQPPAAPVQQAPTAKPAAAGKKPLFMRPKTFAAQMGGRRPTTHYALSPTLKRRISEIKGHSDEARLSKSLMANSKWRTEEHLLEPIELALPRRFSVLLNENEDTRAALQAEKTRKRKERMMSMGRTRSDDEVGGAAGIAKRVCSGEDELPTPVSQESQNGGTYGGTGKRFVPDEDNLFNDEPVAGGNWKYSAYQQEPTQTVDELSGWKQHAPEKRTTSASIEVGEQISRSRMGSLSGQTPIAQQGHHQSGGAPIRKLFATEVNNETPEGVSRVKPGQWEPPRPHKEMTIGSQDERASMGAMQQMNGEVVDADLEELVEVAKMMRMAADTLEKYIQRRSMPSY